MLALACFLGGWGNPAGLPFCLQNEKEDAEGSEEEEEEPSSPEAAAPPPPPPKTTGGSKKSAKKKKKAAGKGKPRAAEDSDADSEAAVPAGAADEEELDAILAEMNLQVAACLLPLFRAAADQTGDGRLLVQQLCLHQHGMLAPDQAALGTGLWTASVCVKGAPCPRAVLWMSTLFSGPPLRAMQPAAGVSQPGAAAAGQQGAASGGRPLLAVDMRQLKADEELRRMFGSRVLEEEDEEGGGEMRSRLWRRWAAPLASCGQLCLPACSPPSMPAPGCACSTPKA